MYKPGIVLVDKQMVASE